MPSKECIQAVDDALSGKKEIFLHIYYIFALLPIKVKGYKKYGQIGDNTYFYKEHDKQQNKNKSVDFYLYRKNKYDMIERR